MLEIQPSALIAAERFITLGKGPDRSDGPKTASRYTYIAAGEGELSIRRTDGLFHLSCTFPASGLGHIPETAVRSDDARQVMGQVGRTASGAGANGEPVRLAVTDDGVIRLWCSAFDTDLVPEAFVSRFPALATAGAGEPCSLLDLADTLRHLSRGHPPDRKRTENAHICTLFPDGLAMAFHRGVTVVAAGPTLANPVSLRRTDARRLAAWLRALRRAAPEVNEVEVSRAEVCGQVCWCVRAVGVEHAVYVPAADRPFPRGVWDRARTADPALRCVVARTKLIDATRFLATRAPLGTVTCTLTSAGGSHGWEMTVAGGARGTHTARVPMVQAPRWAGVTAQPSFSVPTRVLFEGVRLLRSVNVSVELRTSHRRLTLSAHTPAWAQSEAEPHRSDLMVDLLPPVPDAPVAAPSQVDAGRCTSDTNRPDTQAADGPGVEGEEDAAPASPATQGEAGHAGPTAV